MSTTIPVADPRPDNADAAQPAFGPCAVPAHLFRAGFAAVRAFRSTNASRPTLTAILIEHREGGLGLVATDSHTLASITVPWLSEPPEAFEPVMLAGESVGAVWAAVKDARGRVFDANTAPARRAATSSPTPNSWLSPVRPGVRDENALCVNARPDRRLGFARWFGCPIWVLETIASVQSYVRVEFQVNSRTGRSVTPRCHHHRMRVSTGRATVDRAVPAILKLTG